MDYTEKDIENLYREHYVSENVVFVGQQVRVPTGIIDLLFYNKKFGNPIIVEVKKGKAPKTTLAQLLGYVWYLESGLQDTSYGSQFCDWLPKWNNVGRVHGIILAEGIDDKTRRALRYSPNILFIKYQVTNNKVRFFDVWETELDFEPTLNTAPIVNDLIRISNFAAKVEKLHFDRVASSNVGGSYDVNILFGDLKSKDNIVWKRKQ